MSSQGLPLMPTPSGGPAAPIEGAVNSEPGGSKQSGFGEMFNSAYAQSPVVTWLARAGGHLQDSTVVSHDDAVNQVKSYNLDPAFIPKDGISAGALHNEINRQWGVRQNQMRLQRAGGPGFATSVAGNLAAGLADPSNIVLGPAAGAVADIARGGLAVRAALGTGMGALYTGAFQAGEAHLAGHDEDINSWSMLSNMTYGAVFFGLTHSAFGPRALVKPGGDFTLDTASALERTAAAAKARGIPINEVVSSAGAVGEHQVTPAAAYDVGFFHDLPKPTPGSEAEAIMRERLKDPKIEAEAARQYIDKLKGLYPHDPEAVAVAYNDGPRNADRWLAANRNDSILPPETRDYLARLRGSSMDSKKALGAVALHQFEADNPVDVAPFHDNPSVTDDGVKASAQQAAMPDPTRYTPNPDTQPTIDAMAKQAEGTKAAETSPEMQFVNDAKERVAMLNPDKVPAFEKAVSDSDIAPEEGTGMTHDDLTKTVKVAVMCAMTKGVQYAAE